MTTALLLVLPVIGIVTLGLIAKFAIRNQAMELKSIRPVWPSVFESLPPMEPEHQHDPVAGSKAA